MKGTSISETLVIDWMPPMMTRPTRMLSTIAMIHGAMPKLVVKLAATALA